MTAAVEGMEAVLWGEVGYGLLGSVQASDVGRLRGRAQNHRARAMMTNAKAPSALPRAMGKTCLDTPLVFAPAVAPAEVGAFEETTVVTGEGEIVVTVEGRIVVTVVSKVEMFVVLL